MKEPEGKRSVEEIIDELRDTIEEECKAEYIERFISEICYEDSDKQKISPDLIIEKITSRFGDSKSTSIFIVILFAQCLSKGKLSISRWSGGKKIKVKTGELMIMDDNMMASGDLWIEVID